MSRPAVRAAVGAGVLVAVLWAAGPATAWHALTSVDGPALAEGTALAAVTTTGAAWRWRVVARRLGLRLSGPAAVAACYRAQLLNVALPGGVLGDVGRGARHGREADDVARGLRAVAWERVGGQAVLAAVTLAAALITGAPRWPLGAAAAAAAVAAVAALAAVGTTLALVLLPRDGRAGRVARTVLADARALASPRTLGVVAATSLVVLGGHVATMVVAARTVGADLGGGRLVTASLVVLLLGAVPVNVAGWGSREGAAAWTFAASGSDAATGVAVSVAYGAIVLVAASPGAVVILADRVGRRPRTAARPLGGLGG